MTETKGKQLRPKKIGSAFDPAGFTAADASAIQALMEGRATSAQQIRAMQWIINEASGAGLPQGRPGGVDGEREQQHGLGRAFVGQQILGLAKINLAQLHQTERE